MIAGYHDVPREDFDLAVAQLTAACKPGRIYTLQVAHDDACPCAGDRAPMPHCTCATVNLVLAEVQ
jgi:hypothetical protein